MALKLRLHDKLPAPTSRKMKDSGEMIAPCVFARVGVMHYLAKELSPLFDDLPPTQIVRVMRTADELYKESVIEGLKSAPITIGHPAEDVTIDNYKELAHGVLSGAPMKDKGLEDEDVLAGELCLNTAEAIKLADESDAQLSLGYDADLLRVEHKDWDAVQINIVPNHIAIVKSARAGKQFRIGDSDAVAEQRDAEQAETITPAETVETLAVKLADSNSKLEAVQAELDAVKEKLEAKQALRFSDEDFAEAIRAEVSFYSKAQNFCDEDICGLPKKDVQLAVLKKLTGKCFADRDSSYINTRYEIALEDANDVSKEESPMADLLNAVHKQVLRDSAPTKSKAEEARERAIARNAHKNVPN